MISMKRISLIGSAFRAAALPGPSTRVLSLRSFRLALLAAMVLAGLAFWSTAADGQEAEEPVWSADMTVVEYNSVSIGAASADLFSNVGGSGNLQIKSLWSYIPGRDLRLAFQEGVPDAADYTLHVGGLSLEFPADSSGESNFQWNDVNVQWEDGQVIHARIVPTAEIDAPQANTPATGVPTVSGTAQVGDTLTADTSSVADVDGLTNVSYAYQWIRTDGGADADIAGATDSAYTLTGDDQGKTIKLRVTFNDDNGNSETLTSAATAEVSEKAQFLVSNLGVSVAARIMRPLNAARSGFAQAFTTGAETGGYALGSVGIQVTHFFDGSTVGDHLRVTLNGVASEGEPGDTDCTLTNPSSFSTPGVIDFEAPAGAGSCPQLAAETTYFVVIEWVNPSGTDAFALIPQTFPTEETAATDEDPGGAEGWSIADQSHYLTVSSDARTWNAYDETASFKIEVKEGAVTAARVNSPATGLPTITGTAQVGETLTANTSGIADDDGLDDVSYSYQWVAHDGTADTDIQDATDSAYMPSAGDVGKPIKVTVSFTDDAGSQETLTSAATAAVAATAPGAPQRLNVSPHEAGALDLYWEAPGSDGGSPITGYRVQWKEASGSWDTPGDVSEEAVTGTSHTLTGLTGGVEYAVRVIAINDVGDGPASVAVDAETPEQETGIWSADLTVGVNDEHTGYSHFTGFGSLSETGFSVDDANYTVRLIVHIGDKLYFGMTRTMTAGFVLRVGTVEFASGDASLVISDRAYLLKWDQPGLSWSEGDEVGVGLTLVEDSHQGVPDENSPATGLPVISGTAQVGQTLTADVSGIADSDGLGDASFSYQWVRNDGTGDAVIRGATASTYTPSDEEVGKTIKVRVSFADDAGHDESLTSAPTAAVEAAPNSPATGTPAISGVAQVGETLTADTSGIADEDGLDDAVFSHQWTRNDGSADTDIAGATGSTYELGSGDLEKSIKVRVSFEDDAGHQESLTSQSVGPVDHQVNQLEANSPATGAPTISGTARVGETLTADTSGIADEDGLDNVSYSYQWIAGGSDIDGATGSTYTLTSSEQGQTVQVRVTFTDDQGNAETLTSAATAVVVAAPPAPLTASFLAAPSSHDGDNSFTFELRFSQEVEVSYLTLRDHVFTETGGQVTGASRLDQPGNLRWQIVVEPDSDAGVTIVLPPTTDCGALGAICTGDGRKLSGRVELTVDGPEQQGQEPQNNPATGAPAIGGTPRVGETLTASTSSIADEDGLTSVSYSYQWIAGGSDISGATGSTYTLADSDVGKGIQVRVSFQDDAGNPESLTSAATVAVSPRPPLTATFGSKPSAHDGQTAFTFELRFSEEFDISYLTLRDRAFTVTGGTVNKARRMTQGSNIEWTITVTPDSAAAVTVALPVTTDCDADGAVCTADGRKLSNRNEFTVSGPTQ